MVSSSPPRQILKSEQDRSGGPPFALISPRQSCGTVDPRPHPNSPRLITSTYLKLRLQQVYPATEPTEIRRSAIPPNESLGFVFNGIWCSHGFHSVSQSSLWFPLSVCLQFRSFFQYRNLAPLRVIPADVNEDLSKPPCPLEIEGVIKSMHPTKALLSPDGLPALFYQSGWSTIKEDVCQMVQEFFNTSVFPASVNHTIITLIPKNERCESLADYRPIGLCYVLYKVVAKILAKRIRPLFDGLISSNQSALIPGRQIVENCVVAHHSMNLKKGNERFFLRLICPRHMIGSNGRSC